MRIVADENIPGVEQAFAPLGEVVCLPGRQLSKADCAQADILLVRSVTRVDAALLEGSRVRFVATATIGEDHLDKAFLRAAGIGWASAPGSNAESVVEYVISAICRLEGALDHLLQGARVGIIGMGNVGSSLYRRLSGLGVKCLAYDPLIPQQRYPVLGTLESVLEAEIICLHTPLTHSGSHPSHHLLNKQRLENLRPGTTVVNAGRGAVIDNQALLTHLEGHHDISVVLDVWEGEPDINLELMKRVDLATPHIAGYSMDGKLAGTAMIYRACREYLGLPPVPASSTREERIGMSVRPRGNAAAVIADAVLSVYDIAADDQRLRGLLLRPGDATAAQCFDQLRRDYPVRREFASYFIENANELAPPSRQRLAALGFGMEREGTAR